MASRTIGLTFLLALTIMVTTGVVALAYAPRADVDFAGLSDDATCLRVARRADYTIVYMDVGSPMQRVHLLLDLETAVAPGGESVSIFSSRLHKSVSMACSDLSASAPVCAAVPGPGARGAQWQRERPAAGAHDLRVRERPGGLRGESQPAALAGLDGTFRLTRGDTHWLSTTHLCFAPVQPTLTDRPLLLFEVDAQDKLRTRMVDLDVFDPELSFDDRCASALEDAPVRLFPIRGGQRGERVAHAERPLPVRVRLRRAGEAPARRRGGGELLGAHRGAGAPARHLPLRLRPGAGHVRGAAVGAVPAPRHAPACGSTCHSTARAASPRSTPTRSRRSSRPTRTRSRRRAHACSCCCSRPRWSSCAARRTPRPRAGFSPTSSTRCAAGTPTRTTSRPRMPSRGTTRPTVSRTRIISVAAWGSRLVVLIFAAPYLRRRRPAHHAALADRGTGVLVHTLLSALLPRHQPEARRAHHDARWAHVGHRRHQRCADALLRTLRCWAATARSLRPSGDC